MVKKDNLSEKSGRQFSRMSHRKHILTVLHRAFAMKYIPTEMLHCFCEIYDQMTALAKYLAAERTMKRAMEKFCSHKVVQGTNSYSSDLNWIPYMVRVDIDEVRSEVVTPLWMELVVCEGVPVWGVVQSYTHLCLYVRSQNSDCYTSTHDTFVRALVKFSYPFD